MGKEAHNSGHGGTGRKGDQNDQETAERSRLAEELAGQQANVNQVRHEPIPASQHDDPRQDAVERNEELGQAGQEDR